MSTNAPVNMNPPPPQQQPQDTRVTTNPLTLATSLHKNLILAAECPVNRNGSYESDRIIKSGYVQKRTQKTKSWKSIFLVLRPDTLSIYKSDKEDKLRHKIYVADLAAITMMRNTPHKRQHVFGLFTSSKKSLLLQAPSLKDAEEWVDLIRQCARIDEGEESFLPSPISQRHTDLVGAAQACGSGAGGESCTVTDHEHDGGLVRPAPTLGHFDSALSGTDFVSQSDFSDFEQNRARGASIESLAVSPPPPSTALSAPSAVSMLPPSFATAPTSLDYQDPDRVVWQGHLALLRNKGGMKQWKKAWAVLRPRNLILYKDESEYKAIFILPVSAVLNVVDLDPLSSTRRYCMQIITEEKRYRFSAPDEDTLVNCLGAFKSMLSKRRGLEAKAAAAAAAAVTSSNSAALAATAIAAA